MFGQNKIDKKIRYRSLGFKRQLETARNYKREPRNIPQTKWGIFLRYIGLGSWVGRVVTFAVLALLVYLAYFPNLFYIKSVSVQGAGPDEFVVVNSVQNFLNKKIPLPQRNIFLLSKSGLENYLLKNSSKVVGVKKITKDFPNTLVVEVEPRTEEFLLENQGAYFKMSNDGLVTESVFETASGTLPSGLSLIKIKQPANLLGAQSAMPRQNAEFILALKKGIAEAAYSDVSYFEQETLDIPDLTAYMNKGFKMFFDTNNDPGEIIERVKVLFSQFPATTLGEISYVDMRFEDRGYVCYKSAACSQPAVNATTTNETIKQ